jgi:hypothetical protein
MSMFDGSKFKAGEWVQVIGKHSLDGYVGFVEEYDFWDSKYRVIITTNPVGKRSGGRLWISEEKLLSIDNERHEDDVHFLIDFALDDHDRVYFLEISSQLPFVNF